MSPFWGIFRWRDLVANATAFGLSRPGAVVACSSNYLLSTLTTCPRRPSGRCRWQTAKTSLPRSLSKGCVPGMESLATSMIGTHGPTAAFLEVAVLQGETLSSEGPKPLGAQMDSSAFFFMTRASTATTGHGLRPPSRRRCVGFAGSMMAIMAPLGGPLKTGIYRGKPRGRGSVAFGDHHGLVWLFHRRQVPPHGGMTLPTSSVPRRPARAVSPHSSLLSPLARAPLTGQSPATRARNMARMRQAG
jgi:hypothetical protein